VSQVHRVTRVPVHSPLSEVYLPYARALARKIYWGVRCGKERPAEVGGARRDGGCSKGERSFSLPQCLTGHLN
jgi:hypothetical protein